MVNVPTMPVCTFAPVAPDSGVITTWSGVMGSAWTPTAAYTPLRNDAAAMAVTWKLTVNGSPGATGLADGVESTMYCSGNLVPLNVLLHATTVSSCNVGGVADAGALESTPNDPAEATMAATRKGTNNSRERAKTDRIIDSPGSSARAGHSVDKAGVLHRWITKLW